MSDRPIPPEAKDLIQRFEGFMPRAYLDPVGVRSIGWGHVVLPGENFGELTHEQGEELLQQDMQKHASWIAHYIHVPLNDNQFAALLSLVFNLGVMPLVKTLGQKLSHQDYDGAAEEFPKWVYARDQKTGEMIKLPGLVKRRAAEKALFLRPVD